MFFFCKMMTNVVKKKLSYWLLVKRHEELWLGLINPLPSPFD